MTRRPTIDEEINQLRDENAASFQQLLASLDALERHVDARISDPDRRDIVKDIINQQRQLVAEFHQLALDPLAQSDPQMRTNPPAEVLAELERIYNRLERKSKKLDRKLEDFM